MSAPERVLFRSRVLGYEKIRAAQDRLKDRRTTLRARLQALHASLPEPEALAAEERAARERERAATELVARTGESAQRAEAAHAEIRPRWDAMQQARERATALDA